jgi:hypothetical protein
MRGELTPYFSHSFSAVTKTGDGAFPVELTSSLVKLLVFLIQSKHMVLEYRLLICAHT